MKETSTPRYYIVKHGLDALQALPNYIWRTGEPKLPKILSRVRPGDKWIGFAYTTGDSRERPLSLVTGFYECVRKAEYGRVPKRGLELMSRGSNAWLIEGREYGWQPMSPVGVPPIGDLIDRSYFRQTTLVEVSKQEYEGIRAYVRKNELSPNKIPLLRREPRYEQEVLALVASAHKQLGIDEILRIRTPFPDMLVKLRRRSEPIHLELEVYSDSFVNHKHGDRLDSLGRFKEVLDGKTTQYPVLLLCWIDNVGPKVLKHDARVAGVFSVRNLLQNRETIRW
jgi:hypothetical protein